MNSLAGQGWYVIQRRSGNEQHVEQAPEARGDLLECFGCVYIEIYLFREGGQNSIHREGLLC